MTKTREDVLRQIDEAGVRYIRLCFTDILGKIKGMSITRSEIEQVLEEGQGFDGSSVEGFARIEEPSINCNYCADLLYKFVDRCNYIKAVVCNHRHECET